RVLVICHRYGGHWAFPKGNVEAGESEEETAMREVREETGAQVRVRPGYREVTTYSPAKGVTKDVVFFVAEITGGTLRAQPEEVRAVCLLPLEEAQRRLTYAADKELLEKAKNMILDEKNG
ncbi:MAG: bis(5'-nucleosyl)-tetraphosphatase, partial [Ruthenibacterium lactatiformans]